ncbi:hypothetical protein GW17_00022118 [Ensete ventricosum]|nr:hypothetical protein GW17_00022118 [Ensete ventricosum]
MHCAYHKYTLCILGGTHGTNNISIHRYGSVSKTLPIARTRSSPVRRRRPQVAGAFSPTWGERSRRPIGSTWRHGSDMDSNASTNDNGDADELMILSTQFKDGP